MGRTQSCRQEEKEECATLSTQRCKEVPTVVVEEKCEDVEDEKCVQINVQECRTVTNNQCRYLNETICTPTLVEETVASVSTSSTATCFTFGEQQCGPRDVETCVSVPKVQCGIVLDTECRKVP